MSKRIITVRSGKEEVQMEVTEEEYQNYYRPWWKQKKQEQRNREAMEKCGYTEESYEEWKDRKAEEVCSFGMQGDAVEELIEKKELLELLRMAVDTLLPEEKELAVKVLGEEMSMAEFARKKQENRRTLASRKERVLEKLRDFYRAHGFEIEQK